MSPKPKGAILWALAALLMLGAAVYWTGFPWGYDLTDNKTLIMCGAWIVACAALGLPGRTEVPGWRSRTTVFVAAVVMVAVYLIPHSLRGSELDFAQVESGTPATEAVQTGN